MAKKITWLVVSCLLLICLKVNGQNSVGIGTPTPNPKAVLELVSPGHNQGLMVPRLTTAQRTAGSFTSSLTAAENGLLVFDSDDQRFYYWQNSQWLPIRSGSDVSLIAGTGISITGNTISAIADGDGSSTNEIQDLSLTGSTLKITNNASATGIDLSPFAGVDTDDQDLQDVLGRGNNANNIKITNLGAPTAGTDAATKQYVDGLTGGNNLITSINNVSTTGLINTGRIAAGTTGQFLTTVGSTPTWSTISSLPPNGAAGGDLTGTYPSPTIGAGKVTSTAILDGTIASIDIADGTITSTDITDATIANADIASVDASKITTGTLPVARGGSGINAVVPGAVAYGGATNFAFTAAGTTGQLLQSNGAGVPTWINPPAASGTAGGDLTGTYPNPTIGTDKVTSTAILDGTIASIDIADGTITSTDITDATITNADIANVDASKITTGTLPVARGGSGITAVVPGAVAYGGATNFAFTAAGTAGQLLQSNGAGVPTWINPPAASGTAGGDLTGSYPNPTIGTGKVTSNAIFDGTIATADVAADAITTTKILDATIATADIADNAITSNKILDGVVSSADITDNSVATGDILDGTIGTIDIAPNAITPAKVAPSGTINQVLTTTVAGTTVAWATLPSFGFGSVTSVAAGTGLTGGPITTTGTLSIATGGVTATELAANAVTDVKVANVAPGKLTQSGAGSGDVLKWNGTIWAPAPGSSGSVTSITAGTGLSGGTITTTGTIGIAAGGITTTELAANAVATADIANSAVTVGKIAPSATNGQVLTTTGGLTAWNDPVDNSATNEIQNLASVLTTGNSAGGSKIINLGTPTLTTDATTKQYVDGLAAADLDKSASNEIQDLKSVVNQGTADGDAKPIVNVGSLSIGLTSKGANLHVQGSQAVSVTLASGGVFDIKGGDEYLVVGGAATTDIRLPDAADIVGRVLVIRSIDPKGFVVGKMDGADKIDNLDTVTLNDSNGAVNAITVVAVGKDQWLIINKSIKY